MNSCQLVANQQRLNTDVIFHSLKTFVVVFTKKHCHCCGRHQQLSLLLTVHMLEYHCGHLIAAIGDRSSFVTML